MTDWRIIHYISKEAHKYTDAKGLDIYKMAAAVKFHFNVSSDAAWIAVTDWVNTQIKIARGDYSDIN